MNEIKFTSNGNAKLRSPDGKELHYNFKTGQIEEKPNKEPNPQGSDTRDDDSKSEPR